MKRDSHPYYITVVPPSQIGLFGGCFFLLVGVPPFAFWFDGFASHDYIASAGRTLDNRTVYNEKENP